MGTTDIARVIRHQRQRRQLTLEDLAEKVGLTAGALSHIENGRRLPSPETAVAIAQALGQNRLAVGRGQRAAEVPPHAAGEPKKHLKFAEHG